MFSTPHRFEKFTYTTPAYCDYCSHVLWGLVKTGMRCQDCAYNCHEKCVSHVPKNCTRLRPVSEISASSTTISKGSMSETASISGGELIYVLFNNLFFSSFFFNINIIYFHIMLNMICFRGMGQRGCLSANKTMFLCISFHIYANYNNGYPA